MISFTHADLKNFSNGRKKTLTSKNVREATTVPNTWEAGEIISTELLIRLGLTCVWVPGSSTLLSIKVEQSPNGVDFFPILEIGPVSGGEAPCSAKVLTFDIADFPELSNPFFFSVDVADYAFVRLSYKKDTADVNDTLEINVAGSAWV